MIEVTREWLEELKRDLESAYAGTPGAPAVIMRQWERVCRLLRAPSHDVCGCPIPEGIQQFHAMLASGVADPSCDFCAGTGQLGFDPVSICHTCNGTGRARR